MPGDRCPALRDDGDGPRRCRGALAEVGLWGWEYPDDDSKSALPETWFWWLECDLCGWDESLGGVP